MVDQHEMDSFKLTPLQVVKLIRKRFRDENLFFTCVAFKGHKVVEQYKSTFASDNITNLEPWLLLMTAKMASKSIEGLSVVLRVSLKEKVPYRNTEVPKKELYHFFLLPSSIVTFTDAETFDAQYTDAETGSPLTPETHEICKSSTELLRGLINAG